MNLFRVMKRYSRIRKGGLKNATDKGLWIACSLSGSLRMEVILKYCCTNAELEKFIQKQCSQYDVGTVLKKLKFYLLH